MNKFERAMKLWDYAVNYYCNSIDRLMLESLKFKMKISNEKPPHGIYERVEKTLGCEPIGMVFCFGDTIYHPSGTSPELPNDVIAHEEVHSKQQGNDPIAWWNRYIEDPAFRFEQEVQAMRRQFQYCTEIDHSPRKQTLKFLAYSLASPGYGGMVTFEEAKSKIQGL